MKVLIISGGEWHEFAWTTDELVKMLRERRSAECRTIEGAAGLSDDNLDWADVVVINHQGGELSDDRAAALETFVRQGGGLLGIHSAADSFRNSKRYLRLLGFEFDTHGPPSPIRVHRIDATHPITAAVGDEFVIADEIYQTKCHGDPKVLAKADWNARTCPIIAVSELGQGRVCYNALGHDRTAWRHPEFRTLLIRGIDWVHRGPIEKKLGVGLVGVGGTFSMGGFHAQRINATHGLQVRAACDVDPQRLAAFQKDFPKTDVYPQLDKMLASPDIGMVTIITPHNTHAELGLKCLDAGKHVVIEKPFCLTTDEATAMIELADKNNCMLSCFHNRHWDGEILALRQIVEAGQIGRIFQMRIDMGAYGLPREWWRSNKQISGGLLYDWGAHHVEWFLQLAQSPVKSVFAVTHKLRWHWCTNEDNAKVMIAFENGVAAEYHASELDARDDKTHATVWGTEGVAVVEQAGDHRQIRVIRPDDHSEQTMSVPEKEWPRYYWNIDDHLHFGEPLTITADHARRVISLIEAAYRSAQTGHAETPACP